MSGLRRNLLIAAAAGGFCLLFVGLIVVPTFFAGPQFMFGGGGGMNACSDTSRARVQPAEAADAKSIPADYLALYKQAGKDSGIPWNVLAAIGKVETGHGTSNLPGVHSGANYAGAAGPMQFGIGGKAGNTWKAFAVDGNKDGKKDVYDPRDAIPSAAAYLKHNGAPERMRSAIFRYNHSQDYVNLVLSWAKRFVTGDFNVVQANGPDCSDTNLPINASDLVKRIIAFAMAQQGKPYLLGANGPDAWDCSSLVQAAYRQVGLGIPRTTFEQWPFGVRIQKGQEQPGDLVFFNSGPGTSSNNPGHVGMVIGGGKMIVARCRLCQPAIGVQNYRIRSDWIGSTRPLSRPDLKKKADSPTNS